MMIFLVQKNTAVFKAKKLKRITVTLSLLKIKINRRTRTVININQELMGLIIIILSILFHLILQIVKRVTQKNTETEISLFLKNKL